MLRWVTGSHPGKAATTKRTSEEVKESKRKYETKRTRAFKQTLLTGRPWLEYRKDDDKMFCKACQFCEKENKFVEGCDNFRIDTIQAHEVSKPHLACVKVWDNSVSEQRKDMPAVEALCSLKKHELARMNLKFRNAHAIAKHQLSFRTYPILCALDKAKGLDVGNDYNGDKVCRTFVSFIAADMLEETETLIRESPCFSFTCDGSTDFTGDDLESLYIRTSSNGHIKERFFNIGISKSASSEHIHDFVQQSFISAGLQNQWETKLVGFCADGASNMQGNNFDNEYFTFY